MVGELAKTGKFSEMTQSVDEDEHSIEVGPAALIYYLAYI